MSAKLRLASVLLVAALMVVAGSSMLMPPVAAGARVELVELHSKQANGASSYIGHISAILLPNNPPVTIVFSGSKIVQTFATGMWTFLYVPASGFIFLRWDVLGVGPISDLKSNPATFIIVGESGAVIWAIYGVPGVGGVIRPINTYMALTPYLAVIGLVATAAVAIKKRRN